MNCVHGRISYASWRLQTFSRLFLPSTNSIHPTRIPRREVSYSSTRYQGTNSTQNGATEPLKGGPKPSERLPQSPLLTDPRLVDPEKYKKRKRRPAPDEKGDLRKNPWAMALISPVRMCSATKVRLPAEFLDEWGFIQRKDSEALWFSPTGLMKPELASAGRKHDGGGEGGIGKTEEGSQAQATPTNRQKETHRPLMLRMADRIPLIRLLNGLMGSKGVMKKARPPVVRLFPTKWKYPIGPMTSKEEKSVVWRQDMPDFLLERMRKVAMEHVTRAARRHEQVGLPNGVWTAVEMGNTGDAEDDLMEGLRRLEPFERMGSGGVLVMNNGRDPSQGNPDSALSSSQSVFPEFVTLPQTQSMVPVFDMAVLFSKTEQEELRTSYPIFQGTALFLRPDDTATVKAMLALWKLKRALRELQ